MTKGREQLDQATRDRLAKLASMPVDLSRLEHQIAEKVTPRRHQVAQPTAHPLHGWLRLAAVIALFAGVVGASYYAFFGIAPQTAAAQTMTVAELHEHLLRDRLQDYLAQSIEEAQRLIDAQLTGNLPPPTVDGTRIESCCLVEGAFPLRAALVIDQPTGPVTIIVAQGHDFAHPMNPIDHPSGLTLQGHKHAGLPMVMRNIGDRWMCVMGEVPQSALSDVAAGLRF